MITKLFTLLIISLSTSTLSVFGGGEPLTPITPDGSSEKILFIRGGTSTVGFLEGGSDEQGASITNYTTNGGNHSWGELASALIAEGYSPEQITEDPVIGGEPTPVPLDTMDLSQYSIIVFGSNNASYTTDQVDALFDYISDGGGALFISDANFGQNWGDAPSSDQHFLDRFGLVMTQDSGGTYGVRRSDEFVVPAHPILNGIDLFDGEGVSTITVGTAPSNVTNQLLTLARFNKQLNTGADKGPQETVTSVDASLVIAETGSGRIAGHFDRNTFFNENGAGTDLNKLDNEAYARNLFNWLAGKTAFDPATDNYAPRAHFPALVDGTTVNSNEPLNVEVIASDPDGTIACVDLFVDGNLVSSNVAAPYTWLVTGLLPGEATLAARVTDDDGDQTTIWSNVTVRSIIDRTNWTVSGFKSDGSTTGDPGNAIDGDENSRWTTLEVQTPGQRFTVDFGKSESFERIVLATEGNPSDYPRGYSIRGSHDGVYYVALATGQGDTATTEIVLPTTATYRYLEIEQTGNVSTFTWWSIHELLVYAATPDPTLVNVSPIEYSDALLNPLKGFRPGTQGNGSFDERYASITRDYIKWNEIEDDESDTIQKIKDFCDLSWEGVEEHGIKVIPRVYLDWDEDPGNEYWPADMITGDYSSQQFKDRLVRLISRLGECWDDDPRVAWVQMGIIGQWGEHHSPSPTAEIQQLMGDAFDAAFENKHILVRHPNEFTDYQYGIYWDSWAHINQVNSLQQGAGIEVLNNNTERWKTRPIEGEAAYNWGDYEIQPGDDPDDTLTDPVHRDFLIDTIRNLHCTGLGWVSDYDQDSPIVQAGANEVQKAFGYRFIIPQLSFPRRVEADGNIDLTFSVVNTGSAPFYKNWPLEFSLLDPTTGIPVWKTTLDTIDIRQWLPGDDWDEPNNIYLTPPTTYTVDVNIPLPGTARLPAGEFIVALSILEPINLTPSVRFAIENYFNGGRHPFGRIGIGVDVTGAHELDSSTFDDPQQDARLAYKLEAPSPPEPATITNIMPSNGNIVIQATDSESNSLRVLQRSDDLQNWEAIEIRNGTDTDFEWTEAPNDRAFFRILTE